MSKPSKDQQPKVGIIMGSQSDMPVMTEAAKVLEELGVSFEVSIVSAHRTPHRMLEYAEQARGRGLQAIVAGAGGAAHLPGMVASLTTLPVIGVPVKSRNSIDGWDSVLSILQMPAGVPVATVALNGAKNAGILAAQIVGATDKTVADNLQNFKDKMRDKVLESAGQIEENGYKGRKIGFIGSGNV
ncbi:5-(carboxyamino)imidazole ribonucleotide mutase [Roseivirga sp. BDSF3-8]|uniref:5-(carboxyamino)imidazole ribonucleotide mutase n=1 Tax=Roseivirga sp. BDSF3-8 TaxID=3241598 RepID=UPI00353193B3